VKLVDEEHDVARAALYLVENALYATLEFAAVLRARNQRAKRKREHAFALQRAGSFSARDSLREPFNDRGLSNAGLTYEAWVVLTAAREDRNDAVYFAIAPNYGIEFSLARELG
jgi:hypothetical protein